MPGARHQGRFMAVSAGLFAISLLLTSLALLAAHALSASSLLVALVAVTVANGVAAVLRFAILRAWIFRPDPAVPAGPAGEPVPGEQSSGVPS